MDIIIFGLFLGILMLTLWSVGTLIKSLRNPGVLITLTIVVALILLGRG